MILTGRFVENCKTNEVNMYVYMVNKMKESISKWEMDKSS
jgi:hypothetical protein